MEVGVGVPQDLLAVDVKAVQVVPGVAHVALDPLDRVLLGQLAARRRAGLHRPGGPRLIFVVIVIVLIIGGGGRGRAGGGGG